MTKLAFDHDTTRTERIRVGVDFAEALAEEVEKLKASRIFVIASKSVLETDDHNDKLRRALAERLSGVFTEIRPHGPIDDVIAAANAARHAKADAIVVVGGGTPIDAAKIVQLALNENVHDPDGLQKLAITAPGEVSAVSAPPHKARIIAIPTTLSGAEFASMGGALNAAEGRKQGFAHPLLAPVSIIFDPTLAGKTPPRLWFAAGIRAIDHGLEGAASPGAYALLREQFLAGAKLVARGLAATNDNPHDAEGRVLSYQGVWAAASGLGATPMGASHGIGYVLGALHNVPHGETSCALLPAVLKWNAASGIDQRALSSALGDPDAPPAEIVERLIASLRLPTRLEDVGVQLTDHQRIAEAAAQHPVVRTNPRPISNAAGVREILALASRSKIGDALMADTMRFRSPEKTFQQDWPAVAGWLEGAGHHLDLDTPPRQFAGGVGNFNYLVTVDGQRAVLRRPPSGPRPPGANDMAREFKVLKALNPHLPLTPRAIALCEDVDVIGAPFMISEFRDGRIIHGAKFDASPAIRKAVSERLVHILAELHEAPVDALENVGLKTADGFAERTAAGWRKRALAAKDGDPGERYLALSEWLIANAPATLSRSSLVHNDFKLDNIILSKDDLSSPVAVIDWDMAALGDPLFDLATLYSYWSEPGDAPALMALQQMPSCEEGFISRDEAADIYASLTGADMSAFGYFKTLAYFKLAVVTLQLHDRWRRAPEKFPEYEHAPLVGDALLLQAEECAGSNERLLRLRRT